MKTVGIIKSNICRGTDLQPNFTKKWQFYNEWVRSLLISEDILILGYHPYWMSIKIFFGRVQFLNVSNFLLKHKKRNILYCNGQNLKVSTGRNRWKWLKIGMDGVLVWYLHRYSGRTKYARHYYLLKDLKNINYQK